MPLRKIKREEQWIIAGKILKGLRLARKLTQQELSERAGIVRANISMIERGKRGIPDDALSSLAKALGVPEAELVAPSVLDEAEYRDFVIRHLEKLLSPAQA